MIEIIYTCLYKGILLDKKNNLKHRLRILLLECEVITLNILLFRLLLKKMGNELCNNLSNSSEYIREQYKL